jgi:restriction endonuclease S subunit
MSEWKKTTIGDVLTLQRGFDITRAEQRPGSIPVVSSGGIGSYHDTAAVQGPGVVIGRKGTLGKAFYLPCNYWPHDTTLYVKDFKGSYPRFVYYFFVNLDVMGFDVGSANPTLNRNHIHPLPVYWPGYPEQVRIANLLGALDDKIAVNDRIAGTARQLARAHFRAAQDSAGSEETSLASVAEFLNRGIAPRYTEDQSHLRVLNQKCIRDGRVSLAPSRWTISDKVPSDKMIRMHDVLVNSTGMGTLGRVARWTGREPCTVDSHVTIVRFDPTKVDPVCAGFAMLGAEHEIESLGQGSTGQTELSRTQLSSLKITVPSKERAAALRPMLDALENRGDSALEESLSLARLRDTLLPRLMSGEIRVRDAEKVVEDVT